MKKKKPTVAVELAKAMHHLLTVLETLQSESRIQWRDDTEGVAEITASIAAVRRAVLQGVISPEDVGSSSAAFKLAELLRNNRSMVIDLSSRKK